MGPVMISCPGLLPVIDGIAERYPGLRIVIHHLALRRAKYDAAYADIPCAMLAGEKTQCCGETLRHAGQFDAALSVSQHPSAF